MNPKRKPSIDYFCRWSILPSFERPDDEKTLTALAIKLGVSRVSLYEWQNSAYFKGECERLAKAYEYSKTNNIKNALYQKAIDGDVQAIKLWKEWLAGKPDQKEFQVTGEIKVDLKSIIKAVSDEDPSNNS